MDNNYTTNSLLGNQPEYILQSLKTQSYATISVEHWTLRFRTKLRRWLSKNGYPQCQLYRIEQGQESSNNIYIIALPDADIPYRLEMEYTGQETKLQIWLPLWLPLLISCIVLFYATWVSSMDRDLAKVIIMIGVPFVFGMLVEYCTSLNNPSSSILGIFGKVVMTILLILFFSIFFLREGTICVVMALPLLIVMVLIGIITMWLMCRFLWQPSEKIYSIAFLPLIFSAILPDMSSVYYGKTQRSVVIHAPAEKVFYAIQHIGKVQPQEVEKNFIFTMGFPKPTFGMTKQAGSETIRYIQWQRGVHFKEVVDNNRPPYALGWTYQFQPDSFPKGSMDDHVKIGGEYFNLLKTDYKLNKIDDNTTEVTLIIDYKLSTEYNWYSKIWANYVLNQFSDVVMNIHKNRLEHKSTAYR